MQQIDRWHVYEAQLEAQSAHDEPLWDVDPVVTFRSPDGRQQTVDAFWDGGRTWRVRFCPDEPGRWTWEAACPGNPGIHGARGEFECLEGGGGNPLYGRAPVRLSHDQRHFVTEDGDPFFWLADTAWNGAIRSTQEGWERYLERRREQGFTVIQFVATQWRAAESDPDGRKAYIENDRLAVNPAWFQRMDARVDAVNAHGLVAAPVVLWACTETDPGRELGLRDAARLARYIVSRWGAHQVMWILAGDGGYLEETKDRWLAIGGAVFGQRHDRLVTLHHGGQLWIADEIRKEPWFDFIGYQSGHGDSEKNLRWLIEGPPTEAWREEPVCPILNMEPNYEAHPSYHSGRKFTPALVRRAAYWSLMLTPTAGVTYGHNHIWPWATEPELPKGHEGLGTVQPWHTAVDAPGALSMSTMRTFFESLPWWRLRPAQSLLAEQPGADDPTRFVSAAATEDGDLAVAYTPAGESIRLRTEEFEGAVAEWFDPRTGDRSEATAPTGGVTEFTPPAEGDWVLVVRR